jgi:hypothetical protein
MDKFLNNSVLGRDFLYYTCNIRHKEGEVITRAQKQFQNDEVILTKPCDYYLTVPRMTIPLRSIPIFRCVPIDPSSLYYIDENTLEYLVTIKAVGGGLDTTPITLAVQMDTSIQNGTPKNLDYYSIFEYTRFIEMVNKAISDVWITVSNLPANVATFSGVNPPFFYFNSQTQLIEYYGEEQIAEKFELYFNKQLGVFFQGFNSRINLSETLLYQRVLDSNFVLYFSGGYESFYITQINGIDYFKFKSDYDILGNWNTVQSIQVFSNIPINREFTDDFFESDRTQNTVTKFNLLLKELFVFTTDNNQVVRTNIEYQADEFDLIEISKGCDVLRSFSIEVFYTTKDGQKFPLPIANDDSFFVKLMFIKKNYVETFDF